MTGRRLFVEKRVPFQIEANQLAKQIHDDLGIRLNGFRRLCIYDVFGCSEEELEILKWQVFGEPATDEFIDTVPIATNQILAFGYLPGQFDLKADSAKQCIQLILGKTDVIVFTKEAYLFDPISDPDMDRLKKYVINPVEADMADLSLPPRIPPVNPERPVTHQSGFIHWDAAKMRRFREVSALAMSEADLFWIQDYFRKEDRDPTDTEIRVLDTYWSDHCRHTTFETILESIRFESTDATSPIQQSFALYKTLRQNLGRTDHPMTLMDIATIYAKWVRKVTPDHPIEVSEEVNACSIVVEAEGEEYLVMFKNETHNHPTEIEPFGGASTCLGGAIRDPLSGRSVVYQGLRVTGAANVLAPVRDTLPGKLPQRVISKKAALGFSAYGNQIGLPTTYVRELFHPGYEAKRMEVGAVVGAVKRRDVIRCHPSPGDLIILVGGDTGRDGIGGATGSSKSHTGRSLELSASEVQKGNAPIERKLQRLFSHPEVTRIVKKCNDFGAGGVAVAIGELADGLLVNLDRIPTKYQGLSATELAISESQERMALVIDPNDLSLLDQFASLENLTLYHVADVMSDPRLVMTKNNQVVVDLDRKFLNTNGVTQQTDVWVKESLKKPAPELDKVDLTPHRILEELARPSIAMQKGLIEHFDSTIGRTTVLLPMGGLTQMTEVDASVQKLPILDRDTQVVTIMTVGGNPDQLSLSPYRGAYLAVVEALAKTTAVGGDIAKTTLSLQEYFRRLGENPENWGMVFQALLGALQAQADFQIPAIGGKDSMSGTFQEIHVPPTLLAFALTPGQVTDVISPEFKGARHPVYLFCPKHDAYGMPHYPQIRTAYETVRAWNQQKVILSAFAIKAGGWIEAVVKMGFGNQIGFECAPDAPFDSWNQPTYGGLVIETDQLIQSDDFQLLGQTIKAPELVFQSQHLALADALNANKRTFSELFPHEIPESVSIPDLPLIHQDWILPVENAGQPRIIIPAFPGTNCETDSMKAFQAAGAETRVTVFQNQDQEAIQRSIRTLVQEIDGCDLFMLPGGFSAGDEPDGSGKYITAVLLNPYVKAAVERLLDRKGLILGICNGFQALIKSGLLPWGKIGSVTRNSPTLARNLIGRHVATMVRTRLVTNTSPWFYGLPAGTIHTMPVSHGEGRFVANQETLDRLVANHQIVTQYVDLKGNPTMSMPENPNGSIWAIEGIVSPDGLILGKMGHSERHGEGLYQNYPNYQRQPIFESAVHYLRRGKHR